jgi:hypothetical protein
VRFTGLSIVLVIAISGCTTLQPEPPATPDLLADDAVVKSITTAQQVVVVRSSRGRPAALCMAPFPDAVSVSGHETTLSAGVLAKEQVGRGSFRGGEGLGGRSADVLLARELLYRACELATNLQADQELTLKIYDRFLTTLESISRYQTESGTPAGGTVPAVAPASDDGKGDDDKKD